MAPEPVEPADTKIEITTAIAAPAFGLSAIEEVPEYDLEQRRSCISAMQTSMYVYPELQQNVQSWLLNMGDKELAVCIRRNMHTLKAPLQSSMLPTSVSQSTIWSRCSMRCQWVVSLAMPTALIWLISYSTKS